MLIFTKKQDQKDTGDLKVTFHFSSGECINISMSQTKWKEVINFLTKDWKQLTLVGPDIGINFSLVTHYELKNYE